MSRENITFTGKAAETVRRLADEAGVTVAEIVRQAVAREAWFRDYTNSGGTLLIMDENDEIRQVEFT